MVSRASVLNHDTRAKLAFANQVRHVALQKVAHSRPFRSFYFGGRNNPCPSENIEDGLKPAKRNKLLMAGLSPLTKEPFYLFSRELLRPKIVLGKPATHTCHHEHVMRAALWRVALTTKVFYQAISVSRQRPKNSNA